MKNTMTKNKNSIDFFHFLKFIFVLFLLVCLFLQQAQLTGIQIGRTSRLKHMCQDTC